MGDKSRGEIRSEIGKVIGIVADAPTTDILGKMYGHLVDGGWHLGKQRYCWWLGGLMWTEVWKPSLLTCMSISKSFSVCYHTFPYLY
jgi:hypothetical protein